MKYGSEHRCYCITEKAPQEAIDRYQSAENWIGTKADMYIFVCVLGTLEIGLFLLGIRSLPVYLGVSALAILAWVWYSQKKDNGYMASSAEEKEQIFFKNKGWYLTSSEKRWYTINLDYEYLLIDGVYEWEKIKNYSRARDTGLCLMDKERFLILSEELTIFAAQVIGLECRESLKKICEKIVKLPAVTPTNFEIGKKIAFAELLLDMMETSKNFPDLSLEEFEGETISGSFRISEEDGDIMRELILKMRLELNAICIIQPPQEKAGK